MSFLLVCVQTYEKLSAEQNKSCLFFCRDEVSYENLHKKLDMEYLLSEKSVQRTLNTFLLMAYLKLLPYLTINFFPPRM